MDALRGVAALAVVTLHSPDYFGHVASSSHLAVDFFFLLSGFVIAHAYERKLANGLSAWGFARIRLIRLYPLYFLGLALGGLVVALDAWRGNAGLEGGTLSLVVLLGLLMLPVPPASGLAEPFPLNGPSWSLFLEVAVNLIYGVVAWRLKLRALAALVLIGAAALTLTANHFGTLHVGWHWAHSLGGLPRIAFSFFAGVLIFRLKNRLPALRIPPPLLLAVLALGLAFRAPPSMQAPYELALVIILFPALIIAAASNEPQRRWIPTYSFLGVVSYAVYAIHAPLYILTHGALNLLHVSFSETAPWTGIGFWVLLLILGGAAHRLYDAPIRGWAKLKFM